MLEWQISQFNELQLEQLYQLLRVRQEVFVLEQDCPYVDADNLDQISTHIIGWHPTQSSPIIGAYLRITPPGSRFNEPSIGRVITHPSCRKLGYGKMVMIKGIDWVKQNHPDCPIRISAQRYLEKFYSNLGFQTVSDPYLEDNIPHVEMLLNS